MKCPNCQGVLGKKKNDGQGVKYCKACGYKWFILQLSKVKAS